MAKILIVDDDVDLLGRVEQWLVHENYTVEAVATGEEAQDLLNVYEYDLIILDWQLPVLSGVEICQNYRTAGGSTPVLILTGKNKLDDKTTGLDSGADDYLTKPFHLQELSARIRALLRRTKTVRAKILKAGPVTLDSVARVVNVDGQSVDLLPLEFALLEFFLKNPNQVFDHTTLVNSVWKSDSPATKEAVRTCVMALRKKIKTGDSPSLIKTVHGLGYKLETSN